MRTLADEFARFREFVQTHHDCDPGIEIGAIDRQRTGTVHVQTRFEVCCRMCIAREEFRFDLIDDVKLNEYLGGPEGGQSGRT